MSDSMMENVISRVMGRKIDIYFERGALRPLDPITVAAGIRLKVFLKFAQNMPLVTEWALFAATLLNEQGMMKLLWADYEKRRHELRERVVPVRGEPVSIDEKFRMALEGLERMKVIVIAKRDKAAEVGRQRIGFFQVKKDATSDRAIFDCRPSNPLFPPTRKVHLVEVAEVLEMCRFFRTPFFAVADFRHFFYQIGIPADVSPLFSVGVGLCYEVVVVPMGWSWGPWFAESVAVMILLSGQRFSLAEGRNNSQGPAAFYIFSERKGGRTAHPSETAFGFVYYDNFLIVANSEQTRNQIVTQIKKNAQEANAIWKTHSPPEGEPSLAGDSDFKLSKGWVEVLGLEIFSEQGELRWRHSRKTVEKWRDLTWPKQILPCTVAGVVGRLVWDATARNQTLAHVVEEINMLAELAMKCTTRKCWWTLSVALDEGKMERMLHKLRVAVENRWEVRPREEQGPRSTRMIVSDASRSGKGGMIMHPRSRSNDIKEAWTSEEQLMHINELELVAAVSIIERAMIVDPRHHQDLWLGEDNTVALSWLEGGWCRDPMLCERLGTCMKGLARADVRLRMFFVPSASMPADSRSRLKEEQEEDQCRREGECMEAWKMKMFLIRGETKMDKRARCE